MAFVINAALMTVISSAAPERLILIVCLRTLDAIEGARQILRLFIVLMLAPWPAVAEQLSDDDWSGFASADIVVIGEVHDNPHHHINQALAVAALSPGALVFEMLTPELAASVTNENRSDPDVLADLLEWEARGWPDFSMYFPIFLAAPEAAIFGGGIPREDVRRATSEGAAAVFGDGAAIFALDQDYAEDIQLKLEAEQQAAHCNALPPETLPGMVAAQRLRDAALSRAALAAVYETRARAVVRACTHWEDPAEVLAASRGLGDAMEGIEMETLSESERLANRGW